MSGSRWSVVVAVVMVPVVLLYDIYEDQGYFIRDKGEEKANRLPEQLSRLARQLLW
jgi:hypothetical protein